MGKAKRRNFNKSLSNIGTALKRSGAVSKIVFAVRSKRIDEDVVRLISLFGITFEELSEAGLSYEEISVLPNLLS